MKPTIGFAALALAVAAGPAPAHDGVVHQTHEEAAAHLSASGDAPANDLATPFPADLQVRFDLVDQTGTRRTQDDFAGQPLAVFFGYASCEAICSVALLRVGAAVDLLGSKGEAVQPILITVDPGRDTPEAMAEALAQYHPRMIGLTGDEARLADARAAFQVEARQVTTGPDGGAIYAHGSFIYLIGADGALESVIPPILGPERIAEIIENRLFPAH